MSVYEYQVSKIEEYLCAISVYYCHCIGQDNFIDDDRGYAPMSPLPSGFAPGFKVILL